MFFHNIAHLLKWNKGNPYSFWKGKRLFMSFKCGFCGKLDGVHDITDRI